MILRRLAEGVRQQDWFTVVVEVLIVVVGIFLGLQVDDWNEGRQDRLLEQEYLERIISDLSIDIETFERSIENATAREATIQVLLDAIRNPEAPIPDSGRFVTSIRTAGFLYLPPITDGTYNELVASGNLNLLRDVTIKRAIADYYKAYQNDRQWDVLLRNTQMAYRLDVAGILPAEIERSIQEGGDAPQEGINDAQARAYLLEYIARPRLSNLLPALVAHQVRLKGDSRDAMKRAEALKVLILEELSNNGQSEK